MPRRYVGDGSGYRGAMPDITVHRHGDRWSLLEEGAGSPIAEYPSREAAEMAARQRADGGAVHVEEGDPTGLDAPDAGEGTAREPGRTDGLTDHERVRTEQGGV
jgi:hypothetical protein